MEISIQALGPTRVIETRYSGVWLVTHHDEGGDVLDRTIAAHHFRRKESPPQLPGGLRALPHRHGVRLGPQHREAVKVQEIIRQMQVWYENLVANIRAGDTDTFNEVSWEPSTWPKEARDVGFLEAPRGALAHWVVIKDGKIDNYQAVVPSTWNAGPRDPSGQPGAYEAALQDNHRLHDPKQPVEILRTIHSFDPCIACAVHVTDPDGEELIQVKVR